MYMWQKETITRLELAEYLGKNEGQVNTIISKLRKRLTQFAPSVSGVSKLEKHEAAAIEFVYNRMSEMSQDDACDLAVEVIYKRRVTRVKNFTETFDN